jgi:hypothetical protein
MNTNGTLPEVERRLLIPSLSNPLILTARCRSLPRTGKLIRQQMTENDRCVNRSRGGTIGTSHLVLREVTVDAVFGSRRQALIPSEVCHAQ